MNKKGRIYKLILFWGLLIATFGVVALVITVDQYLVSGTLFSPEKARWFLITLTASIALSCFLLIFQNIEINSKTGELKRKKIRTKYPKLSVVGIFLNRFNSSHLIATNVVAITLSAYLALILIFPLFIGYIGTRFIPLLGGRGTLLYLIAYLLILAAQRFVINYRIRKGFYLNNEGETREMIDFIRSNSDNIDFTGTNTKIVSSRDLEDIVLEKMRHIPAN